MSDVDSKITYWLSYGAGVNSTALLIMLANGRLPEYAPYRVVFADTLTERPETYAYLYRQIMPWAADHGICIEVVRGYEGVIERWERLRITGNRLIRSCTDHAKIAPIRRWLCANKGKHVQLIGIHAGEAHRARRDDPTRIYPLVNLDIDQEGCKQIIREAGLCQPYKSGCWCCPFMRKGEIISVAREHPELLKRIARLEEAASAAHGGTHHQWPYSVREYEAMASQGILTLDEGENDALPCECFAG